MFITWMLALSYLSPHHPSSPIGCFTPHSAVLASSRGRTNHSPPPPRPAILRKDFVVDEYQLLEAKAFGADTVLLIVAILELDRLDRLIRASRELGMEPLVEVRYGGLGYISRPLNIYINWFVPRLIEEKESLK